MPLLGDTGRGPQIGERAKTAMMSAGTDFRPSGVKEQQKCLMDGWMDGWMERECAGKTLRKICNAK